MGRHRSIDFGRALALAVVFAAGSSAQAAQDAGNWVGVVLALVLAGAGVLLAWRTAPATAAAPAAVTAHVHHHVNVFPRPGTDGAQLAGEIREHLLELERDEQRAGDEEVRRA